MIADLAPEHMDPWTRNERLYRHLLGLGLVAVPIFSDGDRTRIDHILVSVGLPTLHGGLESRDGGETGEGVSGIPSQPSAEGVGADTAESAAKAGIVAPVESPEIRGMIAPAQGDGDNVVDFPPILG
jgi:catechol 2,3-dioxygenase-like lactoylglutathione lyase family enzyme